MEFPLCRKISTTERHNVINKCTISKENKSEHLLPGRIMMSTLGKASVVSIIKGDHTEKEWCCAEVLSFALFTPRWDIKSIRFSDKSVPPTDKELQKADCGCILPHQMLFFNEDVYFALKDNYNWIIWKCSLHIFTTVQQQKYVNQCMIL